MTPIPFHGGPLDGETRESSGEEYEGSAYIDVGQHDFGEVLHIYHFFSGRFVFQRSLRVARDEDCVGLHGEIFREVA